MYYIQVANSDLDKRRPWKRWAPVDNNREPVTISTNTGRKKQKAVVQPSDKSGHTSTNSQKKKKTWTLHKKPLQQHSLLGPLIQMPHPSLLQLASNPFQLVMLQAWPKP